MPFPWAQQSNRDCKVYNPWIKCSECNTKFMKTGVQQDVFCECFRQQMLGPDNGTLQRERLKRIDSGHDAHICEHAWCKHPANYKTSQSNTEPPEFDKLLESSQCHIVEKGLCGQCKLKEQQAAREARTQH